MSYIQKITVGGETYNLTPSFKDGLAYIASSAGTFAFIPVRPIGLYDGGLYPYLASPYAGGQTEMLFSIDVKDKGPAWGLGVNMYGAIGVYVYTGPAGNPMIKDGDLVSRLGRLGLSDDGAIGVYLTTKDGIGTNKYGCLTLLYDSTPVTLQSGEQLRLYINTDGYLGLIKE